MALILLTAHRLLEIWHLDIEILGLFSLLPGGLPFCTLLLESPPTNLPGNSATISSHCPYFFLPDLMPDQQ